MEKQKIRLEYIGRTEEEWKGICIESHDVNKQDFIPKLGEKLVFISETKVPLYYVLGDGQSPLFNIIIDESGKSKATTDTIDKVEVLPRTMSMNNASYEQKDKGAPDYVGGLEIVVSEKEPDPKPRDGVIWLQPIDIPSIFQNIDYPLEEEFFDIWKYRKWRSGLVEAWGTTEIVSDNMSFYISSFMPQGNPNVFILASCSSGTTNPIDYSYKKSTKEINIRCADDSDEEGRISIYLRIE